MNLRISVVSVLLGALAAGCGSEDAPGVGMGDGAALLPPGPDAGPLDPGNQTGGTGGTVADALMMAPATQTDAMPAGDAAVPDLCLGFACGTGVCSAESGAPVCDCPPHTVGTACESCARGYTGRDCASCVDGYVSDGAGGCIVDPCAETACENGGQCVVSPAAGPACQCAPQFSGPTCTRCAPGHTGPTCTDCLPGYNRNGGVCVSDVCFEVECGGSGGFCVDKNGAPACVCRTGYQGDTCDKCALGYTLVRGECKQVLPFTQAPLNSWFDASVASTLDLDAQSDVLEWRSRPATIGGRFWPISNMGTMLPRHSAVTRGVVFDGDQIYSYSGIIGNSAHYTMVFVVRWNQNAGEQTLMRVLDTQDSLETARITVNGTKVIFEHQGKLGATRDRVEADLGAGAKPARLVIVKHVPFLNGTINVVSDGTIQKSAAAQSQPFARPQMVGLGVAYSGEGDASYLRGTVHELAIFAGGLSAAEQKAVIDYLNVKWSL